MWSGFGGIKSTSTTKASQMAYTYDLATTPARIGAGGCLITKKGA